MLSRFRFGIVLFVCLSLVLSGCAGNRDSGGNPFDFLASEDDENLTPEERRLRDQAAVFNETVFGGAVAGAALLGGLCFLGALFNNGQGLAECAVRAGIGAAIGAVDGYLIAKRQEAADRQVAEIDLVTRELEQKNRDLERLVATSKRVVDQNRERIRDVQLKVAQKKVRFEQLEFERQHLQSNIDQMNGTISNLIRERDNYREVAQQLGNEGRDTSALQTQIREMETRIAQLEQERNELENIKRAMRVG